jgi:hypothetical protein
MTAIDLMTDYILELRDRMEMKDSVASDMIADMWYSLSKQKREELAKKYKESILTSGIAMYSGRYSKRNCQLVANMCTYKSQFKKMFNTHYVNACRYGFLDEIVKHMPRKPHGVDFPPLKVTCPEQADILSELFSS